MDSAAPGELERRLAETWRGLLPDGLEEEDLRLLHAYLRGGCRSPYQAAKLLPASTASVYRRARRLRERRLLLPPLNSDTGAEEGLVVSVKGCVALHSLGWITSAELARCAASWWRVRASAEDILSFLLLLGLEARRRGLSLDKFTICRLDEASVHVLRRLREAITLYLSEPVTMAEALRLVAASQGVEPWVLRAALRVALAGAARTIPMTLNTPRHRAVILIHNTVLFPFAVECRVPGECGAHEESLGFDCPVLREEVARLLPVLAAGLAASRLEAA